MRLPDDYSHYHFILWKRDGTIARFDMMFLSFDFLDQDYDYILCLKFAPPLDVFNPDMDQLTKSLESIFCNDQNTFVILTQKKEAPLYQVRTDEIIYSFSCNFPHFKKMIKLHHFNPFADNLLFEVLDYISSEESVSNRIIVRQIPFIKEEKLPKMGACDVIIPHKGDFAYLQNLLRFLKNIKNINVFAGIDQPITNHDLRLSATNPNACFYSFKPNPVGPYIIRNWLVDQGKSAIIAFQDSDDIPCADRFQRLTEYMTNNKTPLCGSHEIKMDYFNRTVQAVRYPKNVNVALEYGPAHALLHPSSAILRETFYFCNRLSEDKIFANDSKFLYHCYFKIPYIQNIDEFLYIRRLHSGSLTTSPNTGLNAPLRVFLRDKWVVDFTLVKLGLLKIEESCLNYEGPKRKFRVKKL